MARALFIGLSFAFLTAYSLIASALLVDTSTIVPVSSIENVEDTEQTQTCSETPFGFQKFLICSGWNNIPGVGPALETAGNILSASFVIFGGFFQLITFNAGLPAASFITLLIFGPLLAVNAFIIFTAIRGSS